MNGFETDYSKLFAAGLRVIQSRSKGRRSSESQHQHCTPVSNAPSSIVTADYDHLPTASSKAASSRKTFHFPTRLWRLPSSRNEMTESAVRNLAAATNDPKSKPARRRSMPSGVMEETTLDVRIWDWSTRVSYANTILEEEDECVDPFLGKVDPVDAPEVARTSILVEPPNLASLWENELPPLQPLTTSRLSQRDRRVSLQMLPVHTMLPKCPMYSSLDSEEDAAWESTSDSSSDDDESGFDEDWHQFRVEWIDFDVAH